ncbi:GNAT superfamily N-acetyltransferase [Catenulispora sp. GAS73]|uniref:GNAT family N-acetyltransferase n=1 Tax=Catenulispora sp. GAS73 TaxID=3156269 RepID=UPI0035146D55
MEALEAKVNGYLHGNARARAINEACGPFHIGFDAGSANPFLNYAVPEVDAVVTSEDIDALLAAFARRERTPRLEFAPGGAPGLEEALLAAGFEVQQRLPFMVVTAAELVEPGAVDGVEVVVLDKSATDEELRGVALAQREAYGESDEPQDDADFSDDVIGMRGAVDAGRFLVLARGAADSAAAGVPMAGGGSGSANSGTTEIGGIATRPPFRRRGAGAAVTAALSRHLLEVAGLDCVWLSPSGPDQERLYASIGYRSLGEMLFIWKP